MHSLGNHWHHLIAKEQNREELRWISMCKKRKISLLKYKSLLTMDGGIQCSDQFTVKTVLFNLYKCLELFHTELDLVVLANIQAFTSTEETGEKR